jgi:hypothetical protein
MSKLNPYVNEATNCGQYKEHSRNKYDFKQNQYNFAYELHYFIRVRVVE